MALQILYLQAEVRALRGSLLAVSGTISLRHPSSSDPIPLSTFLAESAQAEVLRLLFQIEDADPVLAKNLQSLINAGKSKPSSPSSDEPPP